MGGATYLRDEEGVEINICEVEVTYACTWMVETDNCMAEIHDCVRREAAEICSDSK